MSDFIRALGRLIPLVHLPRWVVPSVIVFGLFTALSDLVERPDRLGQPRRPL